MGTPWTLVDSLRGMAGLTDIRSSGKAAVPPGSPIPQTPPDAEIAGPDYIKIIVTQRGLDQATLSAQETAVHARRLMGSGSGIYRRPAAGPTGPEPARAKKRSESGKRRTGVALRSEGKLLSRTISS